MDDYLRKPIEVDALDARAGALGAWLDGGRPGFATAPEGRQRDARCCGRPSSWSGSAAPVRGDAQALSASGARLPGGRRRRISQAHGPQGGRARRSDGDTLGRSWPTRCAGSGANLGAEAMSAAWACAAGPRRPFAAGDLGEAAGRLHGLRCDVRRHARRADRRGAARGAHLRILVREDDGVSRRVLEAALQRLGHSCASAVDGEEGWAVYQELRPEVLVTVLDDAGHGRHRVPVRRVPAGIGRRRLHLREINACIGAGRARAGARGHAGRGGRPPHQAARSPGAARPPDSRRRASARCTGASPARSPTCATPRASCASRRPASAAPSTSRRSAWR